MRKTVKLLIVSLIILFMELPVHAADPQAFDYRVYFKDVVNSFAEDMQREFGLVCIGDGGKMPRDIEEIDVMFRVYHRATVEEARALQVAVTQKFLEKINAHEKIRPYLREFPFKSERVSVSISFDRANGLHYSDESVARIFPARNKLFYRITDPFTKKLLPLLEEPYAEAEQFVKERPPKNLRSHETTELEDLVDQVFASFEKEIAREMGIVCNYIGGKMANGIEEVGACLRVYRPASMEEARELQVRVTEKLIKAINSKEKLKPYLKEVPLTHRSVKIRLEFRNSRDYCYDDNGLESVEVVGDEITYFKELTSAELEAKGILPINTPVFAKEKYMDALKIVEKIPPQKKKAPIF